MNVWFYPFFEDVHVALTAQSGLGLFTQIPD